MPDIPVPSDEDRVEASAWIVHNWIGKIHEGLPENLAIVLAAAREEGRREERERWRPTVSRMRDLLIGLRIEFPANKEMREISDELVVLLTRGFE